MSKAQAYMKAMIAGNIDACIRIEQEYGLFGYPPEIVSIGLKAADESADVDAAVDAYLSGDAK